MKKYTHAWVSLKAIDFLRSTAAGLPESHKKPAANLLAFIGKNPATFLRGTWFPDIVIKDNVMGGHTWKYYLDDNGKAETKRPPSYHTGIKFVENSLGSKVSLDAKVSDLPDRCEALSQQIRDAILITNALDKGDVLLFNDTQIALFFQMLSHYIADAHMPLHCDNRDFYTPSKLHEDIEGYWEDEVLKYHTVSNQSEYFDLDEFGRLECKDKVSYAGSFLQKVDDILAKPNYIVGNTGSWQDYLGGSNNIWDFVVGVCHVSFKESLYMMPVVPPAGVDYTKTRILKQPELKAPLDVLTPCILADAVMSVAAVWSATWERWELLKVGKR